MIRVMENVKKLNIDKSDWVPTQLGDLAVDISKRVDNPSTSIYDKFVGLEHFVSGELKIKNWGTTENLSSSAKAFQTGDILFARRNAYLRRASFVEFDGCCSGDAFVLRENHDKVVPGFLAFLMNSDDLWNFANSNAAGTMSKRVKWRDLANYQFLLPPKDQQARLAELLWALDEVIEREREVLEGLENCLTSLEVEAYSQNLNFRLGQVVKKCLSGGTPDTSKSNFYNNGIINWITTKTLNSDYIFEGEKLITNEAIQKSAAKVLPQDNILAGTRVGVGKFAINKVDISFSQDITGLLIDKEKVDLGFLVYQLNSIVIQNKIKPLMRGTTIKGILKEDLLNLKISLPSIQIQKRLKKRFKHIKNALALSKANQSYLASLQKSLINQIF